MTCLRNCLGLLAAGLVLSGFSQVPDSFNPDAGGPVYALAVQTNSAIPLGGAFTYLGAQQASRLFIGRVGGDGSLDTTFNPGTFGTTPYVNALAVQSDGKIVVGGSFTTLASQSCSRLGRLNSDGSFDIAFGAGADGDVFCLAIQPDGSLLVGGDFLNLMSQSRNYIGRITNGVLDASFAPASSTNSSALTTPGIYSMALQTDGKIVVGGSFTNLCGQPHLNVARLTTNGGLDGSFSASANGPVYAVALQADGGILVGGSFTSLAGGSRTNVGRLLSTGALDSTFTSGANGPVYSLAVQADGHILAGGSFTILSGQAGTNCARLNSNGTADPSFTPGANGTVYSLGVQGDGKVLVGGYFSSLAGQGRTCIGRLYNSVPATQNLTSDGASVTWFRGYASPEIEFASFDLSTNGTWFNLGTGTRISGGWRLSGVSVPTNSTIRARGRVPGGYQNGSRWEVATTVRLIPPPVIVKNDGKFGVRTNRFGFDVTGGPGELLVEGSTNFIFWTPLSTNKLTSAPFYFSDPGWTNSIHRSYRAHWQ